MGNKRVLYSKLRLPQKLRALIGWVPFDNILIDFWDQCFLDNHLFLYLPPPKFRINLLKMVLI